MCRLINQEVNCPARNHPQGESISNLFDGQALQLLHLRSIVAADAMPVVHNRGRLCHIAANVRSRQLGVTPFLLYGSPVCNAGLLGGELRKMPKRRYTLLLFCFLCVPGTVVGCDNGKRFVDHAGGGMARNHFRGTGAPPVNGEAQLWEAVALGKPRPR